MAAAIRELEEETGLALAGLETYVGHFDYESRSGKKNRQFNFLAGGVEDSIVPALIEHSKARWVPVNLAKGMVTGEVKRMLDRL